MSDLERLMELQKLNREAAQKTVWKIDPIYFVGALIVGGFLALNGRDNLATMQNQQATAKAIAIENQQAEMKARLATASSQRQAETAKARYEAGCQMVFASNDPSRFTSIQQDRPVLDGATRHPIPDGSVVCDQNGNTAIIANEVASNLAFSPDREVIRVAMKRYSDAQYSAPQQ
jgi:hypothetical protein